MTPRDSTINLDTSAPGTETRGSAVAVSCEACGAIRLLTRIRALGDGSVCVYAADLAGLQVQGDSTDEAMEEFRVVAHSVLAEYAAMGQDVPWGAVDREDGDQDGPQVLINV